jgi:hypothetical protein
MDFRSLKWESAGFGSLPHTKKELCKTYGH